MKMPVGKESYGFRWFRILIIRSNDRSFRKLVAQECYNLTHELVTTKLEESFKDGRFSGYTDNAWMTLDQEVREFTRDV